MGIVNKITIIEDEVMFIDYSPLGDVIYSFHPMTHACVVNGIFNNFLFLFCFVFLPIIVDMWSIIMIITVRYGWKPF